MSLQSNIVWNRNGTQIYVGSTSANVNVTEIDSYSCQLCGDEGLIDDDECDCGPSDECPHSPVYCSCTAGVGRECQEVEWSAPV